MLWQRQVLTYWRWHGDTVGAVKGQALQLPDNRAVLTWTQVEGEGHYRAGVLTEGDTTARGEGRGVLN